MKNPRKVKFLSAASFAGSTCLLTLSAVPAAAAPPERFNFLVVCEFFFSQLFCFGQKGSVIQTDTPSGNSINQVFVRTSSAIYQGTTTDAPLLVSSELTQ